MNSQAINNLTNTLTSAYKPQLTNTEQTLLQTLLPAATCLMILGAGILVYCMQKKAAASENIEAKAQSKDIKEAAQSGKMNDTSAKRAVSEKYANAAKLIP